MHFYSFYSLGSPYQRIKSETTGCNGYAAPVSEIGERAPPRRRAAHAPIAERAAGRAPTSAAQRGARIAITTRRRTRFPGVGLRLVSSASGRGLFEAPASAVEKRLDGHRRHDGGGGLAAPRRP